MNIIIDATTTQTSKNSGVGEYTHHLLKHLIKLKGEHQIYLILYQAESSLDSFLSDVSENIYIHRVEGTPLRFSKGLNYKLNIQRAINTIEKKVDSAVYFSPYLFNGFPTTTDLPVVLTVHDMALARFNEYSLRGWIYNFIRKLEYWYFMNRTPSAEGIIFDSEAAKLDYLDYYPNYSTAKAHIVPLGVEMEQKEDGQFTKYLPKDWKEKGYFIYMGGGVQKNKNSEGVVRAYSRYLEVLKEKSDVEVEDAPYLIIAGKIFNLNNKRAKRFRSFISELGLANKVFLTGYYEDAVKYSLLSNSTAFIHLSLCEGFGLAVAEAMLSKTPVIAHNGSSYPEVVENAGILVDGTNPQEGAEALYKLSTDKQLRKEFALKGYNRAIEFDWLKCAQRTYEIIREVHNTYYSKFN